MKNKIITRDDQDKTTEKSTFSDNDWALVAEFIHEECKRRKSRRKDLERQWDDVDRQCRMEPEFMLKMALSGVTNTAWMPEMELPLQAQAHELLCADARRLMWSANRASFNAYADVSQSLFDAYREAEVYRGDDIIPLGEVTGGPEADQEDVNLVVQAYMDELHRVTDFYKSMDLVNGGAFKYGTGILRARPAKSRVHHIDMKGFHEQERVFPHPVPYSVRDVLLDDTCHAITGEGYHIAPAAIYVRSMRLEDLKIAVRSGNSDPHDEISGGWKKDGLKDLIGDKDGFVKFIEFEGDLVVPREGKGSLYVPNAIVNVVVGSKDGGSDPLCTVIRFRWRKDETPSWIIFPYHYEDLSSVYATSPLMKGAPIAKGAAEAFNMLQMAAALNIVPPVQYDDTDPAFAQTGGPQIYPGARVASSGEVSTLQIGDMGGMMAIYQAYLSQYADMTGITAPRLGSQTVSHTTAYSKEQELSRGVIRTVDYVRNCHEGPIVQWLQKAYTIGRRTFGKEKLPAFIYEAKMFVDITKELLPERVHFEVVGADAERDNALRQQNMINGMQMAINLDQLKVQSGQGNPMNYSAMQKVVLWESGWKDVERFTNTDGEGTSSGIMAQAGMAGPSGENTGVTSSALQGINFGQIRS